MKQKKEMRFSEVLKILRLQKKLSQSKAADELGIKQNTLSNYENGSSFPNMNQLLKIAEFYEVSLDDLVYGTTNEFAKKVVAEQKELLIDLKSKVDIELMTKQYDVKVNGESLENEQIKRILEQVEFEYWKYKNKHIE